MNFYDSRNQPVMLGDLIGQGGEAAVYRVQNKQGLLAKIYEPGPRQGYPGKLAWMRAHPPDDPSRAEGHASLAWPLDLVYNRQRRLAGYLMPFIHGAVPLLEIFNPKRRAEILPGFNRRYLHRAARNLAAALGALHLRGYVVGDLNESNVLVTPSALVTLIDTDSFQVREDRPGGTLTHHCPVAKLEYTPPELQGKAFEDTYRWPEHDAFGLGVLVFQLLMEGSHPYRAQWLASGEPPPIEERICQGCFPYMEAPPCPVAPPRNSPSLEFLYPPLADLVLQCFVEGYHNPRSRPTPATWTRVIAMAEKALVDCPNGHVYSSHLQECPYCLRMRMSRPARQVRTTSFSLPEAGAASWPALPSTPRAAPGSAYPWSKPGRVPARRRDWLPALLSGAGVGALSGGLSGALAGLAGSAFGTTLAWWLAWAVGGAAGGMARGWWPGYRLAKQVNRRLGWDKVWQSTGLVLGAAGGGLLGWEMAHAYPLAGIGVVAGAVGGLLLGHKLWQLGDRFGWERILAIAVACGAAWLGWLLGRAAGLSWFGAAIGSLAGSSEVGGLLNGVVAGGLGGMIAGASVEGIAKVIGIGK